MNERGEPVDFTFVQPTAEQLEAENMLLEPLELAALPAESVQRTTAFGVTLTLPRELEPEPSAYPDQATWQADHDHAVTVFLDERGAIFFQVCGPDDDAPPPREEGVFRIPMAGRVGRIELMRSDCPGSEVFLAMASAAVHRDRALGIFLVAPSHELRARLIAAIPTVLIDE
jgi:hypothetical protein